MAKAAAVQFSCSECGFATGKWLGRCPSCGSWSSLVEERAAPASPGGAAGTTRPLFRLVEEGGGQTDPHSTRGPEPDRVLGGGLVPASVVLVSGDPGIGKSTLLLMALSAMSKSKKTLLVTGEESPAQVKLRADRLGGAQDVHILAETNLDDVCATLERERPELAVVDSVQTLYAPELGSAPGSVAQVRESAARLLRVAKESGIAVFLVGHVTKEGAIAGRIDEDQPGSALACALEGTRPLLLEIQALVSKSDLAMPRRVGTGVDPKRLSMIVAVLGRHAGVSLGSADVFVNVAGGVRIDEPGAGLGIALAVASAAKGAPV